MITRIHSERLIVISDLHLGNPFSKAKNEVVDFLRWAAREGFDLCINGDGIEIAQASFQKIARDVPEVFQALRGFAKRGRTTYYVVGNHDIALENFLEDWGAFKVAPFLNVQSGTSRIRIEHGHLYDPFFVRSPRLYEFCTWLGGFALALNPNFYKLWISFERRRSLARGRKTGIAGEPPEFRAAALELIKRGFDAVIFGHTHHAGEVDISGGRYLNSGSWLISNHYVEINAGKTSLKTWKAA